MDDREIKQRTIQYYTEQIKIALSQSNDYRKEDNLELASYALSDAKYYQRCLDEVNNYHV